jgi:tetratricopeptide (TPR) repeat protein
VNDPAGIAQAYNVIGELARDAGDFARAQIAYEECLRLARAIGDRLRIAMNLGNTGYIAQHQGHPGEALRLFQEAVRIGIAINITVHMVWGITAIAGALADLGFLKRAARLMGAADGIIDSQRVSLMPGDRRPYESSRTMIRGMLDEEAYRIAWEQGRAMSINEMLAYALEAPAGETAE